ncbi:phage tail tip protein J-related protein [Providencia manganoxydans]|uniref:phage tail tip protein J-related protein n=1 Tax=Providencia manganoxydans TaxID=2923283 RepID=UPI0034DCDD9F
MGKTVTNIVSAGLMVAGVIVTGGLGTALIAAGIAVQAAGTMIFKDKMPSGYRDQSERKQMLRSASAPEAIIVGKTVCSGLLFFAEEEKGEQTENERLFLALAIAAHKLDHIGQIWLNDDLIGEFGDKAEYEFHNGRTDCDPYMLKNAPSWKEDMIGDGLAWLRLTLKYDAEKFPYGVPNVKVEVWGKQIHDPRTDKTVWSNNGALVILDFYRSYLSVPDSDIDFDAFKVAADLCDEAVTTPEGNTEPRYTINGAYELSESPASILDHMHKCIAAEPTYVAGKHGILMQAYNGPAVLRIEPNQIIDTVNITPELALRDATNAIYGTFVDAEQQYIKTDFEPVIVNEWVDEDGLEIKENMDYRFVSSPYQAARLANLYLRKKRAGRRIQLKMNMDGYAYRPGDVVLLNLPQIGIQNFECRVAEWKFHPQEGVDILLEEDGAYIYEDIVGKPFVRPPFTVLPTGGVAPPLNLTFVPTNIGEVVQGYLSWQSAAADVRYNTVNILENGKVIQSIQVPSDRVDLSGLVRGSYRAEVRSINAAGAMSAPAIVDFDIQAPPKPVSVEMVGGMFSLTCIPHGGETAQHGYTFEFWFSDKKLASTNDHDVTTKANRQGQGQFWTKENLKADTDYWFYVRTVNSYGKSPFVEAVGQASGTPKDMLDELGNNFLTNEAGQIMQDQIDFSKNEIEVIAREQLEIKQNVVDIDEKTIELDTATKELSKKTVELESSALDVSNKVLQLNTDVNIVSEAVMQNTVSLNQVTFRLMEEEGTRKAEILDVREIIIDDQKAFARYQSQVSSQFEYVAADVYNLQQSLATTNEAFAQQMSQVRADLNTTNEGMGKIAARVTTNEEATANLEKSQAKFEQVTLAEFEYQRAYINQISTAFSDSQMSISESVMQLSAQHTSLHDRTLKAEAKITKTEKAVADESKARAEMGVQMDARFGDAEGAIARLDEVQSEQGKTFAQTTEQLRSEIKTGDEKLQEGLDNQGRELSDISSAVDSQKQTIANLEQTTTEAKETQQSNYNELHSNIVNLQQTQASESAANAESALQIAAQVNNLNDKQLASEAHIRRNDKAIAEQGLALAKSETEILARVGDNTARIAEVDKVVSDLESTTAEHAKEISAQFEETDAKLLENQQAIASEKEARALSEQGLNARIGKAESSIAQSFEAISDVDKAQTEKSEQLKTELDESIAVINEHSKTLTTLEESTTELKQTQQSLHEETQSSIANLQQTVANAEAASAESVLQTAAQTTLLHDENLKVNARVTHQESVIVDQGKAQAKLEEKVDAQYADNQATFVDVRKSLAEQDKAHSERTEQVRAELGKDINSNKEELSKVSAAVTTNTQAIAKTDETVTELQQLQTSQFNDNSSSIANVQHTQANADSTHAESTLQLAVQQNQQGTELLRAKASIRETNKIIVDNDKAYAQKFTQIDAQLGENGARFTRVEEALADTQQSVAKSHEQLNAKFDSRIDTVQAQIDTQKEAIAKQDQAIAKVNTDLSTRIGQAESSISDNKQSISDNEQALADFSQLTRAEFDNQQAAIEQRGQTIFDHNGNGSAIYTIKAGIWWNGQYYDSKFMMGAEVKNGQVVTQIGFSADTFGIFNPSSGKLEPVFFVENGQVFINEAFINQATIEKLLIGSTIKSKNWDPATKKGLMLDFEKGKLIANDAEITGKIYATDGEFNGTVYIEKLIGDVSNTYIISPWSTVIIEPEKYDRIIICPSISIARKASVIRSDRWFNALEKNGVEFVRAELGEDYRVGTSDSGHTILTANPGISCGSVIIKANERASIKYVASNDRDLIFNKTTLIVIKK